MNSGTNLWYSCVCLSGIRTRVIESSSCCSERSNHWTIDTTHLMRWYLKHLHTMHTNAYLFSVMHRTTVFELLRIRQINAKFEYNEPITHLMNATDIYKQWVVITNKYQAQTQDGVLSSISISDSGMVIIKRLFSYSDLSITLRNHESALANDSTTNDAPVPKWQQRSTNIANLLIQFIREKLHCQLTSNNYKDLCWQKVGQDILILKDAHNFTF